MISDRWKSDPNPALFRVGEQSNWQQAEVSEGSELQTLVFDFSNRSLNSTTVHRVSWELYTRDPDDLDDLLWNGNLYWDFVQTRIPICPLSHFTGIPILPEGEEPPAAVEFDMLRRVRELQEAVQTFKLGRGLFFRGQHVYEKHHVVLPSHATAQLRCDMTSPFTTRDRVRVRMVLSCTYQSTISVR